MLLETDTDAVQVNTAAVRIARTRRHDAIDPSDRWGRQRLRQRVKIDRRTLEGRRQIVLRDALVDALGHDPSIWEAAMIDHAVELQLRLERGDLRPMHRARLVRELRDILCQLGISLSGRTTDSEAQTAKPTHDDTVLDNLMSR
jgi:hypothetical protein